MKCIPLYERDVEILISRLGCSQKWGKNSDMQQGKKLVLQDIPEITLNSLYCNLYIICNEDEDEVLSFQMSPNTPNETHNSKTALCKRNINK